MTQHLILIGFKHSGKSLLGESLAARLNCPFVDLDLKIVELHNTSCSGGACQKSSCRELLTVHGEEIFRELESQALASVLATLSPQIIALGGGTPMTSRNRDLIKGLPIVHVKAARSVVFERIMINGKPAFFPQDEDAFDHFQKLWNERLPLFDTLAKITIDNKGPIEGVAEELIHNLKTL